MEQVQSEAWIDLKIYSVDDKDPSDKMIVENTVSKLKKR
jgi:hypothetical protein